MSDWQRPDIEPATADVPIVEVPLSGGGPADDADPIAPDDRPEPNWRKIAGLSSLAGVGLGIVVSIVILSAGGDDGETSPTTTLDPDELSTSITAPPTLPPFTTTTSPGDGPPATTSQSRSLFDSEDVAATVATLPPLPGVDPDDIVGYELSDRTLSGLEVPVPRRSVTEHSLGVGGFEQTVTITNDLSGRYLLEFASGDDRQQAIVDVPGGRTYVEDERDNWTVFANERLVEPMDAPDMGTLVRNLQLGPLRADTRGAWRSVTANSLVEGVGGETLREHVVVLDADAVPEWARYAFGPDGEAAPFPTGATIGFAAYVDEGGALRRVTGSAEYGATEQRVVHTIELLPPDDQSTIALPDPERVVVSGAVTAAQLAPQYPDAPVPTDGRSRELAPALAALADDPPVAAVFRNATATQTRSITSVRDSALDALLLLEGSTQTLVDLTTGEAVSRRVTGDGLSDWQPVTGPVEVLLPDPMVPVDDLAAGAALSSRSADRYVTVGDETLRWFDVVVPLDRVALPPALGEVGGIAVEARVFVAGNDSVVEIQLLLDGPESRTITQRFPGPLLTPPVDRSPLDEQFG